jgi:hypothetical protein
MTHRGRAVSITRRAALATLGATLAPSFARAAEFYEGKTLVIVCGYNPGGGVDLGTRLIAEHIGPFIPGSPRVIVQNMEGAGGIVAANHVYNRAAPDGLTLAVPGRDWLLKPLLGFQNARFEPLKFGFIGSSGANNDVAFVHRDTGVRNAAELRAAKKPVLFGGLPGTTINSAVPKVFEILDWPVKVIGGYENTSRIIQAIEQRELDAIYTAGISFARRKDLLDGGIVHQVFQSVAMMPGIPTAESLLDPKDRPLMALAHGQLSLGLPLVAPPGTPPERIVILRKAFAEMARDQAFIEHAQKIDEPSGAPLSGEDIEAGGRKIIAGITPETVAAYGKL